MPEKTQLLFGLHLDAMDMDQVIESCRTALATRGRLLIGVLNAAKVIKLRKDALLRKSLLDCDLLLADGQSIVWASRLLRRPLPERIAGIDIFERLLQLAHKENRSIYLLGARPEVLRALEAELRRRFSGIRIVGSHDGYFNSAQAPKIAAGIRMAAPDMLFLGMPSPKKETFLATFGPILDVPILHGVGGSFDVLAGITKRAPLAWQKTGMEWAYRLLQEPRRLAWRYLATNTAFIVLTARELVAPARAFEAAGSRAMAVDNH